MSIEPPCHIMTRYAIGIPIPSCSLSVLLEPVFLYGSSTLLSGAVDRRSKIATPISIGRSPFSSRQGMHGPRFSRPLLIMWPEAAGDRGLARFGQLIGRRPDDTIMPVVHTLLSASLRTPALFFWEADAVTRQ